MRSSVASAHQGRLRIHAYYTCLVLLSVLFVTFLESHVSILRNGLAGTLYVVVVVVAAMRNFLASVFAVLSGVVGLYYVHPWDSAHVEGIAAYKIIEFLLVASVICIVVWKWRLAQQNNLDIQSASEHLKSQITRLQIKYKHDKKKLAELSKMNQDLSKLVDQFLKDEHYWQSQMAHTVTKIKLKTVPQSPKRAR